MGPSRNLHVARMLFAVAVLTVALVVCCAPAEAQNPFGSPPDSAAKQQAWPLTPAINTFGFRTLQILAAESPKQNVCISPVSLHLALDMVRCGAAGATASQMSDALGVGSLSSSALQRDVVNFRAALNPNGAENIANGMWVDNRVQLLPAYIDLCKTNFRADISNVDLKSPSATVQIDKWVSDNSGGKVDRMLDGKEDPRTSVLDSQVYLSGSWISGFPKNQTADLPFHLANGNSDVIVPQMDEMWSFGYYEDTGVQVVSMPMAFGGTSFVLVLPKTNDGLPPMIQTLDSSKWDLWMTGLKHQLRGCEVALPRFNLKYSVTMNNALKAIGIAKAFGPDADFAAMVAPHTAFHLDTVKFCAGLSVDETGINASVAAPQGGTSQALTYHVVVDHPFFFAVVDKQTEAVLLAGAVYDPR